MAAMTGRPTREQIRRRLHQYAAVDVRQFLIYPRSGCELDYMRDNWLEMCRNVFECAEELDLLVWLYDEFNWPSGRCNGEVMEGHPEFCAMTLAGTRTGASADWQVRRVDGHADLLSYEAMQRFIALPHGRYAQHFGEYLGTRVKGIFTDEPSFMYGRSRTGDGTFIELPYYEGLDSDHAEATGRTLRDDLARAMSGADIDGLWPIFHSLLARRFQASFFTPVREWRDEHGLLFTGHLMCETPPVNSVMANGDPLACLGSFSLPGIDEIWTHVAFDSVHWGTLPMARRATSCGERGGLGELFAYGPVDMPFGKIRQMIWLSALHGITEYLLAVSPMDARGNLIKRDYFTAFTPVQTWFDKLPLLAAESARAAEIACTGFARALCFAIPGRWHATMQVRASPAVEPNTAPSSSLSS